MTRPPTTSSREPAQNIDDDAAAWVACIDRGLSDGEKVELDLWLEGDRRRVGALARARAIWLHAERASSLAPLIAEPDVADEELEIRPVSRRRLLIGGTGALAAALVGAVSLPRLLHRPTILSTGVGEIRRIPLKDGSVVTLDTNSVLEVAFSESERRVTLRSGGAFFEVATDRLRPFLVEAGGVLLRATASAFSVRALAGMPLSVLVARGAVDMARTIDGARIALAANIRATLPIDAPLTAVTRATVSPDDIDRQLSWRNGMLAFEGETLEEAAAMFRRYGTPAIEIDTPVLARTPITGLFAASDPAGFARAIALSLNARAVSDGPVIRLSAASS